MKEKILYALSCIALVAILIALEVIDIYYTYNLLKDLYEAIKTLIQLG